MKIVKLKGGIGNQMFQYAFAKLLEKQTDDEVKLDYSSFECLKNDSIRIPRIKEFNISLQPATQEDLKRALVLRHKGNSLSLLYKVGIFFEKSINKNYMFEPNRAYISPEMIAGKQYYDGYWQSYRYTDEIWDEIVEEFSPRYPLSEKSARIASKMKQENSVFIGIRKGDYAETTYDIKHFGVIGIDYYLNCMKYIEKYVTNPVYYVFSNDIEWCKSNINWGKSNVVYREKEDQTSDFEEFMLMSSCKHAIIMNSTYHWWAAQLIKNPNKIVCCPNKWFFDGKPIDIIPANWTRISVD